MLRWETCQEAFAQAEQRNGVMLICTNVPTERLSKGAAMIKYKGQYIAVASGVHGWAGSDTVCAVADSPLGPYKRQANISEKKTWSSQVTDLIYLKESDTVMDDMTRYTMMESRAQEAERKVMYLRARLKSILGVRRAAEERTELGKLSLFEDVERGIKEALEYSESPPRQAPGPLNLALKDALLDADGKKHG